MASDWINYTKSIFPMLMLSYMLVIQAVIINANSTNLKPCEIESPEINSTGLWCDHEIVTDVIDSPPPQELKVHYGSIAVDYGNVLTPSQVMASPSHVSWEADENGLYTLVKTDPDAPSRQEPSIREFLHWIVGNIEGNNVSSGQTRAEYFRAGPPKGTGLHRYAFLVFKQPCHVKFDESPLTNTSFDGRLNFNTRDFAAKYGLELVAGNFYQAEYDSSVDEIYESMA